jgi:aspartate/methionine/tyrosine aminotransferase
LGSRLIFDDFLELRHQLLGYGPGLLALSDEIQSIGSKLKTDMRFVVDLLKATGVLVNGSGFDPVYGKGHASAVFLPPIAELEEASTHWKAS